MLKLPRAADALPEQKGVKNYFLVQKYCFAAIGIDPTSLERTVFNRFQAWIPMLCMLILCGPIALLAGKYSDDLERMANTAAPLWQCVLAIAKFTLFMWNKEKIVRMVRNLWFSNLKASDEELKILAEENHYDGRVSLFYYCSALVSSILLTLVPFLVAAFYAWKGFSYWESLDLPFKAVYYWDPHASVFSYTINLTWNIIGIYYVLHSSLGVDTLFSWFMRNISAQFRILNLRFKTAADNAKVRVPRDNDTDKEFAKIITECVQYHRHVLELARSFSEVYKQLVFVKFLISCVQIACLTFQFSRGGDVAVQLFNVSFMITVATQLMLYCHGGQKIMDLSLSVGTTIYESFQWQDLSVKSQKLLILPMMRAAKSCNVTGIFFVADLSLFLWVYRAAGSFLTMMISVEETKS